MSDITILDRLDRQARDRRLRPALLEPRSTRYDAWDTLSWEDYRQSVRDLARAFVALGHRPGDAVAIAGPNRTAWVLSDIAAIAAGGMPAGIYSTATAEQAAYIISDSGASLAVVDDAAQAEKILSRRGELPKLRAIVLFPGAKKPDGAGELVCTWEEALARKEEAPEARLDEIRSHMKPEDLASLIYTSGTTGPPKGVMLSHRNLTWTSEAAFALVDARPGDRGVSYLPLAHVAEQMLTIHGPISLGGTMHFVPVLEQLGDALVQVRPNFLFGVPRVWEKIQTKVEAAARKAPPAKQRLLRAARKVGLEVTRARFEGRKPARWAELLYPLFERLVFSKFKQKIGIDRARILVTGAAPMSPATRDFFFSMAVPISDVYGQSEDSGPTSFNRMGDGRLGSVGRPIPGVEVKIAGDGEILVRGPNVFLGYLGNATATQETIKDGWLHSGDIGELDADGFLRITDRKKDLIITAGGKNIAPQNIERLLVELPLVSQAVVIGDRRHYLSALLTLVPEELDRLAEGLGVPASTPEARAADPRIGEEVRRIVESEVNPKLARYETIKRISILPRELSEAEGELTPTLKIKRKVVGERYASRIEAMYVSEPESRASGG